MLGSVFLAAILSLYGYQGGFLQALGESDFFAVMGVYLLLSYAVFRYMDYEHHLLDRRLSWIRNWSARLAYQFLYGLCMPVLCIYLIHLGLSYILPLPFVKSRFLQTDIFIITALVLLVNCWYGILFSISIYQRQRLVMRRRQQLHTNLHQKMVLHLNTRLAEATELLRLEREKSKKNGNQIKIHRVDMKDKIVSYSDQDVAYYRSEKEVIYAHLMNGQRYACPEVRNLEQLKEMLTVEAEIVSRNHVVPLSSVVRAQFCEAKKKLYLTLRDDSATCIEVFAKPERRKEVEDWLLQQLIIERVK